MTCLLAALRKDLTSDPLVPNPIQMLIGSW